jgi:serine/threonine protein kinase
MGAPDTILNGRYQLDQLIGRGGFANVFLATDLRLRRQVAVKVLDPGLVALPQHQDFLARFEREAQAVAALDHPNILGIYDSGETGSTVYLVMPYVAGGSLDERLRREGRLSLNLTGLYVGQAAAISASPSCSGNQQPPAVVRLRSGPWRTWHRSNFAAR